MMHVATLPRYAFVAGGHAKLDVARPLRRYLQNEWERLVGMQTPFSHTMPPRSCPSIHSDRLQLQVQLQMQICKVNSEQAVEGPKDCAPKQWATAHPGVTHPSYATLQGCPDVAAPGLPQQVGGSGPHGFVPADQLPSSMDLQTQRDVLHGHQLCILVPQDNGWDCGLFLLTTLEFSVFSPPEALTAVQ